MYVLTYIRQLLFAFAAPPVQRLTVVNCLHYTRRPSKVKISSISMYHSM